LGFPVFARSICPNGTTKEKPGLLNMVIQCGGMEVNPGDVVVGDDDGVVIVPQGKCEEILQKAKERQKKEDANIPEFKKGRLSYELQGLENVLRKKGVIEI
jgi:4-hydroxy-4-methyl-2-oxoglutarate aldolase